MNSVVSLILRAKHWHLFLLFLGLAIFGSVTQANAMAQPETLGKTSLLIHGALFGLSLSPFVAWLWAMGSLVSSIMAPSIKLNTGLFHVALLFPAFYMVAAGPFFLSPDVKLIPVVMPLHFFAVFCLFYDLYFVAKNLTRVESGRRATFYDYAGPFFLIWFFPVGVWFVQPRINRLYARLQSTGSRIGHSPPVP